MEVTKKRFITAHHVHTEKVSAAGRVVELGYGEIRSEISHKLMMQKEVDVCGTRLSANCFPEAIRYIEEHQAQLEDFVTQEYPIDQLQQAFDFVVQHPDQVRKAQIALHHFPSHN